MKFVNIANQKTSSKMMRYWANAIGKSNENRQNDNLNIQSNNQIKKQILVFYINMVLFYTNVEENHLHTLYVLFTNYLFINLLTLFT